MKTPHRLIHDAKEAGVITEEEWRAFMRANNEYHHKPKRWYTEAICAFDVLYDAFCWEGSRQGGDFWIEINGRLEKYEEIKQEAEQ